MPENLDCLDVEDLDAYSRDASNAEPLRGYAAIKARAMRARLAGDVQIALRLESACDRLYQTLPESLKW